MVYPYFDIVIATYNSEKTIVKTLDSIKSQNYPKNRIKIFVIDGGSTDDTIKIARKYRCKELINTKREDIFAKHIGYLKSSANYLVYLDSDELLESKDSLRIKVNAFRSNTMVFAIVPSGYKSPTNYPEINDYINEFGDPFSFFLYRESKSYKRLINDFSKRYKKIFENKYCVVFDYYRSQKLPLFELMAGGCTVDLKYLKKNFPEIKKNPSLVSHLFYLINKKQGLVAITKNDNTIHYSCDSLGKYLKKISSRVKNNVFQTKRGESGFFGREQYDPGAFKIRKFLFLPYTLSLFLPVLDSIWLALTRKKPIYLIHPFLCLYTSSLILYYYFLKALNFKPEVKSYGV